MSFGMNVAAQKTIKFEGIDKIGSLLNNPFAQNVDKGKTINNIASGTPKIEKTITEDQKRETGSSFTRAINER